MAATGKTYRKTCRLTPRSTGTCIQWREAGAIERLMQALHGQVHEQLKKSLVDDAAHHRLFHRCKIPAMRVWIQRGFVSTKRRMALNGIWRLIPWDFPFLRTVPEQMFQMMLD